MEHVEPEPRLSQMSTHWTVVFDAHSGTPDQVSTAVSELMCRYSGAVHRYFLKAVRDPSEAEELVGRELTAGAVRQAVLRSRRKFVDFLLSEVLESLDRPSQDELEEELGDLDLLQYCRPYLKRRIDSA